MHDILGIAFGTNTSIKDDGGNAMLPEDQLLMGAWHQKVNKGSKAVSSMFGSDISDSVGQFFFTKQDDI